MDNILIEKMVVFIKVLPLVLALFVIPGGVLRSLISTFAGRKLERSLALDFSLGYSILLFPGLAAYFLLLKWSVFLGLWFGLIALLLVVFFLKDGFGEIRRLSKPELSLSIPYALSFYVLGITVVVLFLRGGHFIGDHQHHLAYIIKLLYSKVINPYVPMYEGSTVIPYGYAYDINYLFSAILVKLSGVDLNLYWDNSPALFFLFTFSAYQYLFKRLIPGKKAHYIVFAFLFIFYELHNWGPALDAEFMPIPDQFSRTIFLPVFFAVFLDAVRGPGTKRGDLLYIPVFGLLASILFTHVYSYGVIILVAGAFTVVDFVFSKDYKEKAGSVRLYISLMLFSLFLFFIRSWKTDFVLFLKFEKYYIFILVALAICVFLALVSRKLIEKVSLWSSRPGFRKYLILFFVFVLLSAFWKGNQEHVRYMNYADMGTKYGNFLRFFEFSFFQSVGILASFVLFLLSFSYYRIGKNGQREIVFTKGFNNEQQWNVIDQRSIFLLFSISLVLIYTAMPLYNVKLSKLISEVYARRMVSFQDTYFIYWIALVIVLLSGRIRKLGEIGAAVLVIFLVLLSVNLALDLKKRLKDETWNRDYVLLQENNVFEYIRENVEPWSVIASYKYAAMDVVAQTPNYFVSSRTVHSPKVPSEDERQLTTNRIFAFNAGLDDLLYNLDLFGCSYILTEHNNTDRYSPTFDLISFNKKLSKYPKLFKVVYKDSKFILYQIVHSNLQ